MAGFFYGQHPWRPPSGPPLPAFKMAPGHFLFQRKTLEKAPRIAPLFAVLLLLMDNFENFAPQGLFAVLRAQMKIGAAAGGELKFKSAAVGFGPTFQWQGLSILVEAEGAGFWRRPVDFQQVFAGLLAIGKHADARLDGEMNRG